MVPTTTPGQPGTTMAPHPATIAAAQHGKAPVLPTNPFPRASTQLYYEQDFVSPPTGEGVPIAQNHDIPVHGALLGLLEVIVTGTANNAGLAVTAFQGDGPFSCISNVLYSAPNGSGIVIPANVTGYDLYLMRKWGFSCEEFGADAQADPDYSAIAGAGVTGGSFNFRVYIPIRIRENDCFGYVMNEDPTSPFQLTLQRAADAQIYTVAPSGGVTISYTLGQFMRIQPPAVSDTGAPNQVLPNGIGSWQQWTKTNKLVSGGVSDVDISTSVGIDYPIRSMIFVLRDVNSNRTDADWPSIVNIKPNDATRYKLTKQGWQNRMRKAYNYTNTASSVNGLDLGVYVIPFLTGFWTDRVSSERGYNGVLSMPVRSKFQVEGQGTGWGANAVTLFTLINVLRATDPASLYGSN